MKILWRTFFKKRTPDDKNAFPTGSRVYFGFQGQGKSLSMVNYAFMVKKAFPKCRLYSNMVLNGIEYQLLRTDADITRALRDRNGKDGVLILLDEAHLYFGKKTGISLDVLTAISQQRKDRRKIVFSSQIWEELDISLRKQVKEIVKCKRFFNMIFNFVQDGETLRYDKLEGAYIADTKDLIIYKMNDEFYNRYDTYQKIMTNEEYQPAARAAPAPPPVLIANKKGIFDK